MNTMAQSKLFGLAENRTDVWSTPQDFFEKLDRVFNFDLDVCALPENAKCERFFTPEIDGLKQEWTGTCWMNPPYGREIVDWISKAAYTAEQGHTVVALVPVRTDARWFQDYCLGREIHFIRGRLKFGGSSSNAPFGCCVVVFRPSLKDVQWIVTETDFRKAESKEG
ncbi:MULTISPECIES: DNA N-6-adenine-methyltransferase [Acinetobacter calcoaceticus/baumannii complex]|uniref:DNA N-6-adenine-methyltransferase n=1 Tax=Acinetobacter calcoaceticus/baumannii complex TaxID=909768 RepID=UPI001230F88B|nr:DNA N-6-adenine-methyltransferase [Acinetobacter baumannii]EHU3336272.1 adenine methyltransferase [Acinetobacter baumannii]BBR72487.1 DNA N-6-adenine-methyltransferase of bacteriophage [Acinetobacter baumannii]